MKPRNKIPTKEGYYWRYYRNHLVSECLVFKSDGAMRVKGLKDSDARAVKIKEYDDWFWFGPLQKPHETIEVKYGIEHNKPNLSVRMEQ